MWYCAHKGIARVTLMSSDEEDSPRDVKRESHKSLPHHDSLRELELKEARAEGRKSKKINSSDTNNNTYNNNNNNTTSTGMISGSGGSRGSLEPTTPPSDNSNSSLLKEGSEATLKKKGAIVSVADIEITPQERLHVQDTLDPELHRVKTKKKKKKLMVLRRKPVVEDKTPRRIYFNDPARNASFKYLYLNTLTVL